MSGPEPRQSHIDDIGQTEAESILENLRALRDQIVTAWRERAVMLSREEQAVLEKEIKQICGFLADLTRNGA